MSIIERYFGTRPIFSLYIVVATSMIFFRAALADVQKDAPWPLETTPSFRPVYGDMIGVSAQDGDYIGLFSEDGSCYGLGVVRSGRYFASAYRQNPARELFSDDYADKGFENGDEVVFKIYRQSTKEELELQPNDGNAFHYVYEESTKDQPVKVDLAYKRTFHVEIPSPSGSDEYADTQDTSGGTQGGGSEEPVAEQADLYSGPYSSGSRSYAAGSINFPSDENASEVGSSEEDAAEKKLEEIEKSILDEKGLTASESGSGARISPVSSSDDYEVMDYGAGGPTYTEARRARPATTITPPSEQEAGASGQPKAISQVAYDAQDDREMVLAKALTKETKAKAENIEYKTRTDAGSKGLVLSFVFIAVGIVFIIIAVFLAVFKKEDKEEPDKRSL